MNLKKQNGFTLVETLIAITILAFLSVYTTQTIRSAIDNKDKTDAGFDGHSKTRDALKIMERDINLAYHFIDYHTQLYNLAQQERIQNKKDEIAKSKKGGAKKGGNSSGGGSGGGSNSGGSNTGSGGTSSNTSTALTPEEENFKPRPEKSNTHFIGEEKEIHFATLSFSQTRENKSQSDQGEVSYFIKNCSNRLKKDKKSKCLVRRTSHIIDEDPKTGGDETVLLENIDTFKMSYLGPETGDEWIKSWNTQNTGISNTAKGRFPFAVLIELSMTIKAENKSQKDRTFNASTVAKLHFPNNQEKKEFKAPTSGANNSDPSKTSPPTSGSP